MSCNPEIVLNHSSSRRPRVSVILIDWGVRESFHSLHYLNRQTVDRTAYELIWLEFYDRKPEALRQMLTGNSRLLDKWLVLGYPNEMIFHKHRLYNVGLLAANGDICVICDSDAVFSPTFVENVIGACEKTPRTVVHLDEIRNNDRCFYPFNYPSVEEILGPGCLNWTGATTTGLATRLDRIHRANYGACMAARRRDILAIGGADEHLDYLGYVCGPYDLTFRLANYYGRAERWLRDEYLYHTWHPNTSGINADYHGPHDGRFMSLLSLELRTRRRITPHQENPLIQRHRAGETIGIESCLDFLRHKDEPAWRSGAQPADSSGQVYWVEKKYQGYNVFVQAGSWYALPKSVKHFDPHQSKAKLHRPILRAESFDELEQKIAARREALLGPVARFGRKVFAQPLSRLPARAWRKSRHVLSTLWQA